MYYDPKHHVPQVVVCLEWYELRGASLSLILSFPLNKHTQYTKQYTDLTMLWLINRVNISIFALCESTLVHDVDESRLT